MFTGLESTSVNTMKRNRKRFCHSRENPVHVIGHLYKQLGRMAEILGHAAVNMNAKHMQIYAAVGPSDAAGIAVTAIYIRINDNLVADLESLRIVFFINSFNNTGEFVADDSGIGDQLVGSAERADIGTAYAGGHDTDQSLSLSGLLRSVLFNAGNFPGLFDFDSFHKLIFSFRYMKFKVDKNAPMCGYTT